MTFKELGLKPELLSAVHDLGFVEPTAIQKEAIPYLLTEQSDLVGLASTGTGKTAAFGLPLLNNLDFSNRATQGLIICPTRELCIQIARDLDNLSTRMPNCKIVPVYGGQDITKQFRLLDRGAHIIVATPGRLKDLVNRRKVNLGTVDVVVLDEADEMLNMGFKEDIDYILSGTPEDKSVWLFSATMPKEVSRIASKYMSEPKEITVGGKNETNKNIEHHHYIVKERDRFVALKAIIDSTPGIYGLIFCRTRRETAAVADKLMAGGYNAEPLHGDLSQAQRDRVMDKFRRKTLQILVATDVAARGIDVDDITHVIHHKLPEDVENYTHRAGRTARAGRKGVSLALINTKEGRKIKSIEKIIGARFEKKDIPTGDEIRESQLLTSVNRLKEVKVNEKMLDKHMPEIMASLNDFSREELIKRFLSAEFNRFFSAEEKKSSNLNAKLDSKSNQDYRKKEYKSNVKTQRFFVKLGQKDGLNRGAILRIICDQTGLTKDHVGQIDILKKFSFFDVDFEYGEQVAQQLKNAKFEGKPFQAEKSSGESESSPRSNGGGQGSKFKKKKMTSKERRRSRRR